MARKFTRRTTRKTNRKTTRRTNRTTTRKTTRKTTQRKWSFRPVPAGRIITFHDQRTGGNARKVRLAAGLTQRQIARRMKISIGYVSDLELGENRWTEELVERYTRALNR